MREVVPTVERTGMDEGYLDLGEVAGGLPQARALAEAVQVAVRGATRLSCSLGVATCKVVAKVASDRRKPGGITVVRPGREAAFLAPLRRSAPPGVGPRAEAAPARRRASRRIGALAALEDGELARAAAGKGRTAAARPRAGDRPAAARDRRTENVSISQEETFARDVADREQLHAELRRMAAAAWPSTCSANGQVARTVTTKLRYPDFSIRSRSTTLPVGSATRSGSASSPARCSTARSRTGRARCASSASASRTSSRTSNSSSS